MNFCPLFSPLRASRVLTLSEKHQEMLSAPLPSGDLICERCLCNGVFQPGLAGHTVWNKQRRKKKKKKKGKNNSEKRRREKKETGIWIVGYWPLSCLHAGILCTMPFSGGCVAEETTSLKAGIHKTDQKKKMEPHHSVVWYSVVLLSC